MKKLVATAPRVAALVEYEDRAILANEVKIRVRFGAPKHGTEVVDFRAASPFIDEDFNGEWQMFTPRPADAPRGIEFGKFQLGNMVVGDIIECGSDVTDYAVGDSVCGYGPLSETVIINAVNNYKLRKMPQGSSWKNAVCYDPAQFAMSGVRDANVRVGDFVVVVGLGAIGQIAIQLAKRAGASVVIGVDPIAHRCDIARRHGADFCLNPIGTDVGKEIKTLTGKQGADVIIETSGYADALQSALRGLAYGGTISYVAFAKPFAEGFNLGREAHFNNAKIVFSRACSEPNSDYPRWSRKRIEETCWELLMNGYLNCEDLIDPVVTFANSPESYMQYVDQHPEQMGILLGILAQTEERGLGVVAGQLIDDPLGHAGRRAVVEGQVDPVRFRHRPDQRRKYAANKVRRTDIHSSFCSSRAGKKALRRLPRLPARSGFVRRRKSVRQDTSRHSANPATGEPPEKLPQSKRFRTNCQNVGSAQERPQPSNPRIDRPMRPRRRSTDTTRTRTC